MVPLNLLSYPDIIPCARFDKAVWPLVYHITTHIVEGLQLLK